MSSVCVVVEYATNSVRKVAITLILCQRNQRLRRQGVRVVDDNFSTCLRNQRLCGQALFKNINLHFVLLFLLVYFFF